MKKLIFFAIIPALFSACSNLDLERTRATSSNTSAVEMLKGSQEGRSKLIKDNATIFDSKLMCVGNQYWQQLEKKMLEKGSNQGRFKIGITPILDKTGKVFPSDSTAMSDMLLHSLGKFGMFDIVELPPISNDVRSSRNNFLHRNYEIPDEFKRSPELVMGSSSTLPVGVLFPVQYYIAGSLTQYDESSVLPDNQSIKLDVNAFGLEKATTSVTVGINLRLIDATTGQVVRVAPSGRMISISLANTFYKIKISNNLFRIINSRDYGISHDIEVADPKNYATQEILDMAILKMFETRFSPFLTSNCE